MLETMKMLMGVSDTSKDDIFKHYIDKAILMIKGYWGIEEIPVKYDLIMVDLAIFLYRNRDSEGYKSISQGSRAVSFSEGIPETIKLALPKPRLKVGGKDVL